MSRPNASTVDGVLTRSATRWPDRIALRFEDREWTYAELEAAVSRAAAALLALGVEKGDRVAAYGRNSDAYLLGFLACSRAGLVHVPINYALTGEELAYLLEQSGSRAVLYDPKLQEHLEPVRGDRTALALRDADGSLLERARAGDVPGDRRRPRRRRPRPAALHLRHDLAAEGRDDDPPGARARVRVLRRVARHDRGRRRRCTACRSTTRPACTCSCCRRWRSARRTR